MKKFEEIWKKANEEAESKYEPRGTLAWGVFLKEALEKRIEPLLEKQQPEIPEFVAKYIEKYKGTRTVYGILDKISRNQKVYPKLYEWVFKNEERQEIFAQAWLNGYTVAKEKRFYLKNKLTGDCLARCLSRASSGLYVEVTEKWLTRKEQTSYQLSFTQQEIYSMETGSYEQFEVEE